MSASVPLDTLLMAVEAQEGDFIKKDIIRAAREEIKALSDDLAWTYELTRFYAKEHADKLGIVKYMARADGEERIEKFCRNDQFAKALEAKYPWLKMQSAIPGEEMAGFDKAYRVLEATEAKIEELIPRPKPIEEDTACAYGAPIPVALGADIVDPPAPELDPPAPTYKPLADDII